LSDCKLKRQRDWEARQAARQAERQAKKEQWETELCLREQARLSKLSSAEERRLNAEQRTLLRTQRQTAAKQRTDAEKTYLYRMDVEQKKFQEGAESRRMLTAALAFKRMVADWQGLQSCPLPGVAAQPVDDDMQTWHFNLRGARGELQGLVLHGVLRFPPSYPCDPPELRLCTPAPHPNIIEETEGFGVCMDMLETGAVTRYGGWSSSYSASSILLQLQSVLFDERACLYDRVTLEEALTAAEELQCSCGHCFRSAKPAFSNASEIRTSKLKTISRPIMALSNWRAEVKLEAQSAQVNATDVDSVCEESTCASEPSGRPPVAVSLSATWEMQVCRPTSTVLTLDKLEHGCTIESHFKVKGGTKSKRSDIGKCVSVGESTIGIAFTDGVKQTIPREWISRIISCAGRALPRYTELELECEASSEPLPICVSVTSSSACTIGRLPLRLLVEMLLGLAPEDASNLASCSKFFSNLGEDGHLWKHFFRQRYPGSELTAENLSDWKHCFLLEVHGIASDLTCFHTKQTFRDSVLGLPVDYSVNPRTHKIDYISTTFECLSAEGFDSGVRLSQWNEDFKDCIPLYLSEEHFQQGRARLEEAIFRLSPNWDAEYFKPAMVLEVLPKLMNTMVVLLCDKGLEASDRVVDGYFLVWRLLAACVETYGLQKEICSRLSAFKEKEQNRCKEVVPSLGDLIPLLTVCDDARFTWATMSKELMSESLDRNVLWACRANPEFSLPKRNILGEGADADRLNATFESTKVSKRLYMFHVHFLELVTRQNYDVYYGRPPSSVRTAFKTVVQDILAVSSWDGFFAACRQRCPNSSQLTDSLKQATLNSLRKGYHSERTDFSRIHASGVSHILKKGETYRVSSTVATVNLVLGSDSSAILCGACLVYEDLTCTNIVHYCKRQAYSGAIRHSGDTQVNGKSKHTIDVDLNALPSSVNRLFLTLCSCGCTDLSGFKNPAIDMGDGLGSPLCTYSLEQAGNAPTVVMAAIWRSETGWQVTAIGQHSAVRCCGDYSVVKRDIQKIKL
jgi:ubiquitin-protein ligase/stress response protein SCP2